MLTLPPMSRYARARLESRFWEKVDKGGGEGDCWLWNASCDEKGYGFFYVKGHNMTRSSRVSFLLTHGSIGDGLHVLHHCDNPTCVRPDHLYAGTNQQNMDDMKRRGRKRPQPGHHNPAARFNPIQVEQIRNLVASGMTPAEVARQFKANPCIIYDIIYKKTYANCPGPEIPRRTQARGFALPHTKLSDDDVRQIRKLAGTAPHSTIAEQFGVCRQQVSSIIARKARASVKD